MKNKLDVYYSKVFYRLRNKTQLFYSKVSDHCHTRLQHTVEVEEIALLLAKEITNENIRPNLEKISLISLLHDIGHTPFGHAGERALHEIVSGKCCKRYGLPDFKSLGIIIAFKHNLNSALLYRENVKFSEINYEILDGIAKHSKLRYDDKDGLDYGFEYIFHGNNQYYKDYPCTLEGFIVYYADEIAQICSDYLDISLSDKNGILSSKINSSFPFKYLGSSSEKRIVAKEACIYMVKLFKKIFCKCRNYKKFKNNELTKGIKEFNECRKSIIKSYLPILKSDKWTGPKIKKLFAFYYLNPPKLPNDFFSDFIYRVKRINYVNNFFYYKIEFINAEKSEVLDLINEAKEALDDYCNNSNKGKFSKTLIKNYRTVLKMFIRSIAIHISKMTDNYAIHQYTKIVDKNK